MAVCKAPLSLQAEGWYFEVEAPCRGVRCVPVSLALRGHEDPHGFSKSWQDVGPHERQARCSEDFIDRGSSCH